MKRLVRFLQSFSLKIKLAVLITFLVGCISSIAIVLSLDMAKNQADRLIDDLIQTTILSNSAYVGDFILTDNRWEIFKFLKSLTSSQLIEEAGFTKPDRLIVAHTDTATFRMGSEFVDQPKYEMIPLYKDGVMLGFFALKLKKQSLFELIVEMFFVQILLMIGFGVVALVIARYFVVKTIDRLNLLVNNTRAVAQKKWGNLLPYEGDEKDEITVLLDNTTELMHDIRSAMEHEEKLKEFYHSVLSKVDTLIIIFDAHMQIQFHNNHPLHSNVLDPHQRTFFPKIAEKLKEIMEEETQTLAIPSMYNAGKKPLSLLLRIERIQENYVATILDITTLKKEEKDARILHSLNAVGEISASFAHEIKNLLQPLKLLLPKESLPDEEDLPIIHTTLARMDGQVSDFLSLGRPVVASGVVSSINPIMREVSERFSKKMKQKALHVKSDVKEAFCVALDPEALHLIFSNLLSNAIEAAYEGTAIVVALERQGRKRVHISVSNHGDPVPESVRKNFFKPFFTTKKEGSGLGLFTVYKIVYLNHGFMEVEQQGDMITFHLFLPLEECACV
ncbi:MAG: GHKL domain-containing protein [Campylobacterales bacterium]|nr:GHKL domain-containing protein [Campylobacterales bacterium]